MNDKSKRNEIIEGKSIFCSLIYRRTTGSFKEHLEQIDNFEYIILVPSEKLFVDRISDKSCIYKLERDIVLKQPEPVENKICVFSGGIFFQVAQVKFVLQVMLSGMKQRAERRFGLELDMEIAKTKLLIAFENIAPNFKCGCTNENCSKIMEFYGENGISPDRQNDDITYDDEKQIVTFVIKAHNTRLKDNSVPRLSSQIYHSDWETITASNMYHHITNRAVQLEKKNHHMSEFETKQLIRFKKHQYDDIQALKLLLLKKKDLQQKRCFKCTKKLYFGTKFVNVNNKASPDRIDNHNIFYDEDNFRLVCIKCNEAGICKVRTHVKYKVENNTIPFTKDLIEECKVWLQK